MASHDDDEEEEEEYSDVDFWGGKSPRLSSRSPPATRPERGTALNGVNAEDEEWDKSEEETDEDDEGEEEEEEEDDDENVFGEDEGDETDQMEIFGHR